MIRTDCIGLALLAVFASRMSYGQCHQARLATPAWNAPNLPGGVRVSAEGNVVLTGDPTDRILGNAWGSVRVHRYDGWSWNDEGFLPVPADSGFVQFGAIAIDGDVIVVGGPGVDGAAGASGAAYVYRSDPAGSGWVREALITASDGAYLDSFGDAVAVSGDIIVIGAPRDDDNGQDSGTAYVYRREGTAWIETGKLLASDGRATDEFGTAVAMQGDVVIIGAPKNTYPCAPCGIGAAYVFRLDKGTGRFVEEARLAASDGAADNGFGRSVDLSGDAVVVGASGSAGGGAAYVYRFAPVGPAWKEARIQASDSAAGDRFGTAVVLSGERLLVGAPWSDDPATNSGSAYLFRFDGAGWTDETRLVPADAGSSFFGASVVLTDSFAVASADSVFLPCGLAGSPYIYDLSDLDGRDCNGNGICDGLELLAGDSADDNRNGVPDECDIASGRSADCNRDGSPDDGEPDCNRNGIPDDCDIASGASPDCNGNATPDECERTYALDDGGADTVVGYTGTEARDILWMNRFIVAPGHETIAAVAIDWRECDIPRGAPLTLVLYSDPDNIGDPLHAIPLSITETTVPMRAGSNKPTILPIEPTVAGGAGDGFFVGAFMTLSGFFMGFDTNSPYQEASWVLSGQAGVVDLQDLSNNANPPCLIHSCCNCEGNWTLRAIAGAPGACTCASDLTGDCTVDGLDMALLLAAWGPCPSPIEPCPSDLDGDGIVGIVDLLLLLQTWG